MLTVVTWAGIYLGVIAGTAVVLRAGVWAVIGLLDSCARMAASARAYRFQPRPPESRPVRVPGLLARIPAQRGHHDSPGGSR